MSRHRCPRRDDHAGDVVMGHHFGPGATGGVVAQDPQWSRGPQGGQVHADAFQPDPHPAGVLKLRGEDAHRGWVSGGAGPAAVAGARAIDGAEQAGIGSTVGVECHQLAWLAALGIDDLQLVARVEGQNGGAAAGHPVALDSRSEHQQPRHQNPRLVRCDHGHDRLPGGDGLRWPVLRCAPGHATGISASVGPRVPTVRACPFCRRCRRMQRHRRTCPIPAGRRLPRRPRQLSTARMPDQALRRRKAAGSPAP